MLELGSATCFISGRPSPANQSRELNQLNPRGDVRSALYPAVMLSLLAAACGGDSKGPPGGGNPTAISVVPGAAVEGQAGTLLGTPLTVRVANSNGQPVANAIVTFSIPSGGGSLSAGSDTTDAAGTAAVNWTLGQAVGAARVEARVQGVPLPAIFNVTIRAGPAAGMQRVSNPPGTSAGGFELADSVALRVADSFGNPVSGAAISFAVTAGGGSVAPANATTGVDGVVRAAWRLGATGAQTLSVNAGPIATTVDATATTCSTTQIAPGSVLTIGPTDPKCVVLGGTASRYLITVVNVAPAAGATTAFRMRGAGAVGTPNTQVARPIAPSLSVASAAARAQIDAARERMEAHDRILRENERVIETLLPRLRNRQATASRANRMNSMVPDPPPAVGDTLDLRIPSASNLCSLAAATNIRARVVFVGQHGVMLEDVAAPLAGQTDALYQSVGQEFDTGMWTLLNENFGNPLAYDTATDNNERFYMLFSHVVNNMLGGTIAGFVSSGDFFLPADCPAGNQAEIFYARVPDVAGAGTGSGTAADWYRRTRTVMVHEVKHIVSFAERFANPAFQGGAAFNAADRWLEESTAMLAEEIWGRTIFGLQPESNVDYLQSVHCELRADQSVFPECPAPYKPFNIVDHFVLLYQYQSNAEGLSPIGATGINDFTFYGSGWSFLRWLIDHYAVESTFLTATTHEVILPGVQNIEARTGLPFAELVNNWAVALVMDDYPGFAPADARHTFAGWDSRDIFAGLNRDVPNTFPRPVPLVPRAAAFGKFAIDVGSVRGGSMAVVEVSGTQAADQLFEFGGLAGTTFPADMRVNIIRVQ